MKIKLLLLLLFIFIFKLKWIIHWLNLRQILIGVNFINYSILFKAAFEFLFYFYFILFYFIFLKI